jgi:hypothetical protein
VTGSKRGKHRRTSSKKQANQQEEFTQTSVHNMGGGNMGPASMRGSGVAPGGQRQPQAEPESGYSEAMGFMAGRDDDWPTTAGSDKKAVAWTDEVPGDEDTFGPTPQAMPRPPGGRRGKPGRPGFRVRGPVNEAEAGQVDDQDPAPDDPDADSGVTAGLRGDGGHVTVTDSWSDTDEGDPDIGSGRGWD